MQNKPSIHVASLLVFSLHLWYCFAKAESAEEITPLDFRCLLEKQPFLLKTL